MVQSLLEVTFLLNLFCSNTILALLPEWSTLGKNSNGDVPVCIITSIGLRYIWNFLWIEFEMSISKWAVIK